MKLLTLIDRKIIFRSQKGYLKSYLFFGLPFGYIVGELFKLILVGWSNYSFQYNIIGIAVNLIVGLIIAGPFIINYFRQNKKLKSIIKKHRNKTLVYNVKCIINYKKFVKGELYEIEVYPNEVNRRRLPKWYCSSVKNLYVVGDNGLAYELEEIINKFELVDNIKEERKKKLKKLEKLM